MLARDIEMFIEHCGLKGLSTKTINKAKVQAQGLDYKKDKKEIKKIAAVEMQRARDSVGASGSKTKITFTDREWEAVQAGAISDSKLMKILNSSKSDEIIKRAMPKASTTLSSAKL